jgi:RES domain-containing protein
MTKTVWRIAVEGATHTADDLSGAGSELTEGRWNRIGTPVLYASTSVALATLETVYAIRNGELPFNRYLVRIDVPEEVWATAERPNPLSGGWDAVPAGKTSRMIGERWIASGKEAILLIPSAIVPVEDNVLINPRHPDAQKICAQTLRKWFFDPRFFS